MSNTKTNPKTKLFPTTPTKIILLSPTTTTSRGEPDEVRGDELRHMLAEFSKTLDQSERHALAMIPCDVWESIFLSEQKYRRMLKNGQTVPKQNIDSLTTPLQRALLNSLSDAAIVTALGTVDFDGLQWDFSELYVEGGEFPRFCTGTADDLGRWLMSMLAALPLLEHLVIGRRIDTNDLNSVDIELDVFATFHEGGCQMRAIVEWLSALVNFGCHDLSRLTIVLGQQETDRPLCLNLGF
jgi:hypothetical protein